MKTAIVWSLFFAGTTLIPVQGKILPDPLEIPKKGLSSDTKRPDRFSTFGKRWSESDKVEPGTRASIEEFPGAVQIEFNDGYVWVQGCAGSVLTSLHVLTAARCVYERYYNDRFCRVRAGSSSIMSRGVLHYIQRTSVHPDFGLEGNFHDADVAVIRLLSFFVFGPNIQQTPITSSGFHLYGGLPVTHVGWGTTAQGVKFADRYLYKIELVTVDHTTCSDLWSLFSIIKLTPNMICVGQASSGGRDIDLRDFGAPIYYDNVLVGIVSWGQDFGVSQYARLPLVVTNVSSYVNWIVETAV